MPESRDPLRERPARGARKMRDRRHEAPGHALEKPNEKATAKG